LNIVQELLKRGAIVNATTRSGRTPLHLAALARHPRIVHALIKAGANPKFKSNLGRNAYNHALNNRTRNAVRASSAVTKWQNFHKKSIAQNFHKKSIARKRAPNKNLAEKVFSPKRVRAMTAKYGNNWLNKV
jgi:ankyrin repeat protein